MENYFSLLYSMMENDSVHVNSKVLRKNYLLFKKSADNINPNERGILLGEDEESLEVYKTYKELVRVVSLMRVTPPLFLADKNRLMAKEDERIKKFLLDYSNDMTELKNSLSYDEPNLELAEKKMIIKKGNNLKEEYWNWRRNYLNAR